MFERLAAALPHDKCLHALAGLLIFALVYAATLRWEWALGAVAAMAVAKEAWDSRTHAPEPLDIVATLAGALPALAVVWRAVGP